MRIAGERNHVGEFARQVMLGSEAIYRVLDEHGQVATVEVVRAPGLAAGTRLRLMTGAVRAMTRVDADAAGIPGRVPVAA